MSPPPEIVKLVERFQSHGATYRSAGYNEAQLREEFLNPFFAALGWDVYNRKGYAEAYKEVIHEDAIKVGGRTKAPDYCFRVGGGVRSFFVEAKKPSVDIRDAISPAFQLRRYAWSAKLPVSILTDFEEFAVYDCRVRPVKTDKASTARVIYHKYTEYLDRWDDLSGLFSPEAIRLGALDKFVTSKRVKKGTAEVDAAFLGEIESWRELLARNIALRNPALSQRDLNFAVQRTIDRVIFLRICEDRGIEPYGRLQALLGGDAVYPRLGEMFHRADERYNSGLFYFTAEKGRPDPPDELTLGLSIDDKPLKELIKNLYYPDSPYEFSVLPAETLGQVYEQFLGKVIRLTAGHRAVVEDKPEVKKAGGVYYTPAYIVDYIVEHTVGKLVEGKTPRQVSKLRVLDPACGSGSFLIGAYQYLLNWHRDRYVEDDAEKHARGRTPRLYRSVSGDWRLTTSEKKQILLNNIHGVDIDSQAVEVTKLSLLLKVLEGESQETLSNQLRLFHERALPDLSSNIKCGNSLIGPDFYEGRQMSLLDEEEMYRVNVFDWQAEFAEIFKGKTPGFDAVIGNPPYVRIQAMKRWAPLEVDYYKQRYVAGSRGNYDIYVIFIEAGLKLLKASGTLGHILPHKFFNAKYGEPLRALLAAGRHVSHVVHFGDRQVFERATTYTCLFFLAKSGADTCDMVKVNDLEAWRNNRHGLKGPISADAISAAEWSFTVGPGAPLFSRLAKMPVKLGDISSIFVGLQTSADTVFLFKDSKRSSGHLTNVYSKELGCQVSLESDVLKPVIRSGNIGRYSANPTALILFPYKMTGAKSELIREDQFQTEYPSAWGYLCQNKELLANREHGKFKDTGWYQLYPKNLDVWEQPKVMLPYMITRLSAFYDEGHNYFVNVTTGGFGITLRNEDCAPSIEYLTGLLNSRVLDWFLRNVSTTFHGGYFAANKQFLVQLPVRTLEQSRQSDRLHHDRMVELVDAMLSLHKQLPSTKTAHAKTVIQRQIDATDRQIDRLVYELYDLTDEEIAIVEEATS